MVVLSGARRCISGSDNMVGCVGGIQIEKYIGIIIVTHRGGVNQYITQVIKFLTL